MTLPRHSSAYYIVGPLVAIAYLGGCYSSRYWDAGREGPGAEAAAGGFK